MTNFWKNAGRGYMTIAEPFNTCWSYLFSREWRRSLNDMLVTYLLFMTLVLFSPFAYLCIAPIAAIIEGTEGEDENECC